MVCSPALCIDTQKLEPVTLQLQWKYQYQYAGFFVAKERGFYRDVGLRVDIREYQKGMDVIDTVLGEEGVYGVTSGSLIWQYFNGKPLFFIANFLKQSPLALVTQPEIISLEALKGKKVMGMKESPDTLPLQYMLQKFGIGLQDIVSVPETFSLQAFKRDEVAAKTISTISQMYDLEHSGVRYNIFSLSTYGMVYCDNNLFTSQREWKHYPDRVKRFREASIRGWKYVLEHQNETVDLILHTYNTQHKTHDALLYEARMNKRMMLPSIYPVGSINEQRIRQIVEEFIQADEIRRKFFQDLDTFYFHEESWSTMDAAYAKETDYTLLWKIFAVLLLIGTFLLYRQYILYQYNQQLQEEVKRKVEELRKKDELLVSKLRMAAMGEMLSMIAHQWRQPLGAISNILMGIDLKIKMGKFDLSCKEERKYFLQFLDHKHAHIKQNLTYLSHTIDDFKNFFKPDKKKAETTIIQPIERALSLVRQSLEDHGIIVSTQYETDAEVLMVSNEIMQVILNILKNSEANFKERNTKNPHITIHTKKDKKAICVILCDNGGGISEKIISRIFDPYYTTKDEINGTGLGLYMSKMMVEEHHNGRLIVKNTEDGVCFTLYFRQGAESQE